MTRRVRAHRLEKFNALVVVTRWAVGGTVVLLAAALALDALTYDAAAWRRDYERLKVELAQGYANLDWMVERRGLDLAALDARTGAAIDNAHSRVRAFLALRAFVRAFNDPHLRLVPKERNVPASAPNPNNSVSEPHAASCEADGYSTEDYAFQLPFAELPGWAQVSDSHFPTGVAGDLGVLRISEFGEIRYLAVCQSQFRPGLTSRELQLVVRAQLQRDLTTAIADLRQRGVRRLLIDITDNGGGTEWVVEVVALLTDKRLQRSSPRLVAPTCDRTGVWRGEQVCEALGPAGPPDEVMGIGAWTGPLFILADDRTGSASEDFIVWLTENEVATVLGQRTAGAGCGYIDGGGRIRLHAAPMDVMAPNCARFLANGTNEIEGIAPDVEVNSSDAAALAAALFTARP